MILHLLNAALITNMQAMVSGASLEKTISSSESSGHFGLRFKLDIEKSTPIRASAVTSTLTFSRMNAAMVMVKRIKTAIISKSMVGNIFMAWVNNKFYLIGVGLLYSYLSLIVKICPQ